MKIIGKLLRKNVNLSQLIGFTLSNFVGLSIIIVGLQFYVDVRSIWEDQDSFIKKDYLVVNKHVDSSNLVTGDKAGFSESEITDIAAQSWVRKIGRFTSADYRLYASVGGRNGRTMSTYMFFESIPTEFIDVDSSQWTYKEGDKTVPIIISKDYLSLYNFGFASTTGLPQLSENMMGSISLQLQLGNENNSVEMNGKIVGFSNRLNTILVPQQFMDWSNETFGSKVGEKRQPSRLIIDVSSPGDVKIAEYLKRHNMEPAGEQNNSTAAYFLNVTTGVILAVGILITVMSLFILMLSIALLMQKNRQKMHSLLMLGVDFADIERPYRAMVIIVSTVAFILATVTMFVVRMFYVESVGAMGAESASPISSIVVGLGLTLIMIIFNIIFIKQKVSGAFRN